jgi:exonuclease SbcC
VIPILLTLQGIYSYQEKQVIDFEQLTKAGLFGIFGKVGSGKSSIVEAITYALYGESHRMSTGTAYNITNLRSKTIYIEYIFRIAAEQYRFTAEGRRNKNNFDDVKIKRSAYQWNNEINDWMPIPIAPEKIIGLKYEDFRRAVIVPQGNFQEFLELKGNDRSQMMQALFGLEKFDLSHKIKALRDTNLLNINTIDTKLAEMGELSEDAIEVLKNTLQTLNESIKEKQQKLTFNVEKSELFKQIKAAIELAFAKKNQLQIIESQLDSFEQRKKSLNQYNTIFAYVKPVLNQLTEIENEQKETSENLAKANNNLQTINADLLKAQEAETHIKKEYQERDVLKLKADELRKLEQIKGIEIDSATESARLKKGEEYCKAKTEDIENLKQKRQTTTDNLNQLKSKNIDIQVITNVLNWFITSERIQSQFEKLKQENNNIIVKEKGLVLQKLQLNSSYITDIQEDTSFEAIKQQLENTFENLQLQKTQLEQQSISLLQQQALQQHVHALHDGEPCPLCGAAHHPNPISTDENIIAQLNNNEQKKQAIKTAEKALSGQKDTLIQLVSKSQAIENEKVRLEKEVQNTNKEKQLHEENFVWSAFSKEDKSSVEQANNDYAQLQHEIKTLETQITDFQLLIEKAETDLKSFEKEVGLISQKIQSFEVRKQTLLQGFKVIKADDFSTFSQEVLLKMSIELENKYKEILSLYDNAVLKLQQTNALQIENNAKVNNLSEHLTKVNLKANHTAVELQKALQKTDCQSINDAKAILAKAINPDKETAEIQAFFDTLKIAQFEANLAAENVKGKIYEAEAHQALETEINELKASIKTETEQIGSLNSQIAKAKESLLRQKSLLSERKTLQLRADNIATLDSLFRSKAFVNYVSKVYLVNLVAIANERFQRMTQQQLQLQLADDNSFEVLDVLNDGKTRSVKTLSGGQKFQASLCLALALADSISSAARENFFFLDEGFGSLDKAALQVVFETLQSLRKENRVVGIISHVEDMQNEIERYIQVRKDDTLGSLVEVV